MKVSRFLLAASVALLLTGSPASGLSPFIVYFDSGSAEIDPYGRVRLAEAAQAATLTNATHLRLYAHTDTVGSSAYNMGLARRRGEAVEAELVRRGVSPAIIESEVFGEARPAVETEDGVANEDNRRVEIVFVRDR
jgi:outer membrane protein OmpA-like peptidoglycan-associated protein